ncbi:MAG TPA: glycosyltransferase, partial [Spirochaetota bacterium]|nr:glycosyltransferase [Spirochaetota bacterium]
EAIFTGFVNWDIVYRLYSISDIFVTASLSEVHPMTLIEASMCKLAIVARKDDSYLDLVRDGVNGFLVENDEEITNKIKMLTKDKELLNSFKRESFLISKQFSSENHVARVEKFYQRVLKTYPNKLK